eukprot:1400767-Pyramimonas_sp.AAC.1
MTARDRPAAAARMSIWYALLALGLGFLCTRQGRRDGRAVESVAVCGRIQPGRLSRSTWGRLREARACPSDH